MTRRSFLAAAGLAIAAPGDGGSRINAARLRQYLEELSVFGRPAGGTFADGVSRVGFSDADMAGRAYVMKKMRGAGLDPRIDTAGNIWLRAGIGGFNAFYRFNHSAFKSIPVPTTPTEIGIDDDGAVFLGDWNGTIRKSTNFGQTFSVWATGLDHVFNIAPAPDGTDVWIVANSTSKDKVFKYANAAGRLSGSQTATSSFGLAGGNANPKDIVTDGTSLWVVDDGSSVDKVFKYTVTGSPQGSWAIDPANARPTGLTVDKDDKVPIKEVKVQPLRR